MSKKLKFIIGLGILIFLMAYFKVSIFIGSEKLTPSFVKEKITSIDFGKTWKSTKEKFSEVRDVFKKDKEDENSSKDAENQNKENTVDDLESMDTKKESKKNRGKIHLEFDI